jgi:hypothetical protein
MNDMTYSFEAGRRTVAAANLDELATAATVAVEAGEELRTFRGPGGRHLTEDELLTVLRTVAGGVGGLD